MSVMLFVYLKHFSNNFRFHEHCICNILIFSFQATFEIEQVTEDQNIIICDGIGLKNKNFS